MEKILSISLKLNSTPNNLGCYGSRKLSKIYWISPCSQNKILSFKIPSWNTEKFASSLMPSLSGIFLRKVTTEAAQEASNFITKS